MIQWSRAIGPFTLGVHFSCKHWATIQRCYLDIHLPFTVITLGNISEVEYHPDWWASARDIGTGVKYDDDDL